jgi:hypothetical protein
MVKIIPIGGIGEIGMNMILLNSGGGSIVIDCGILFPPFQNLGVETVVADYYNPWPRGPCWRYSLPVTTLQTQDICHLVCGRSDKGKMQESIGKGLQDKHTAR